MRNIRLIARLDIKAPNLVKGIQLEGLRKMGDPNEFALKYYLLTERVNVFLCCDKHFTVLLSRIFNT